MHSRCCVPVLFIFVMMVSLVSAAGSFSDLVEKGDTLYDEGNYVDALKSYDTALNLDDTKADLYEKKARCLFELNRYKEALAAVKKSLTISDTSSTVLTLKGDIEKKLGISDKSEVGTQKPSESSDESDTDTSAGGSINLEDYQLFNALYLKNEGKEYLTFVPVENECEPEEKGYYYCPGSYAVYSIMPYSSGEYLPGEEKQLLINDMERLVLDNSDITVEKESYNNKFQYYRIEGYENVGTYKVAVSRLIDNTIVLFGFYYADQKTSDLDKGIQDYMVESLEQYERKETDTSNTTGPSGGGWAL